MIVNYIYLNLYSLTIRHDRGLMVIVFWNGHGDSCSDSERGYLSLQ